MLKHSQGIYILGKIQHKHVRANPKVHEEYERLRNVAAITMCDHQMNQSESPTLLVISLLNIRSLNKHSIDIKFDSSLCNSDIIAFTETQLLPNSNDNQIRENLQPFTLLRQDHVSDRFSSLALCAKNNIEIKEYEYFPAINAVKSNQYLHQIQCAQNSSSRKIMRITIRAMCQKCDNLDKQILQCRSELSKICPAILILSIRTKIQEVNSKLFTHLHQIKAHKLEQLIVICQLKVLAQ